MRAEPDGPGQRGRQCRHVMRQRIRNFKKDVPINCEDWVDFEVLGSCRRYWRIRYTETVVVWFFGDEVK